MKSHEFKSDLIYKEIKRFAEENNGEVDADKVTKNLELRGVHINPGDIESRIKFYNANDKLDKEEGEEA